MTLEERLRQLMADILDLDPAAIDGSTSRDSVEAWDSLRHVTLCLALEQEFDIALDAHEIESMISYEDVWDTVQRRL